MSDIHPTAIVEDGARLGEDVRIGAYSDRRRRRRARATASIVHPHVVVSGRTEIGAGTEIFPSPRSAASRRTRATSDEPTSVAIGRDCIIREHATVHRGTARGRGDDHDRRQLLPDDRRPCRP